MRTLKRIRTALALVLFGLLVQLATLLTWSPLTFVVFAVFGVTSVGAGAALFLWAVWRQVEAREAAAEQEER
jgi:protein-S-isoprenylcysteine O-methyltransferase Ste14